MERNRSIDVLRGIAILLMLLGHTRRPDIEYSVHWIPPIRTMIPVVRHSDSVF